jgi:hypothetical protein
MFSEHIRYVGEPHPAALRRSMPRCPHLAERSLFRPRNDVRPVPIGTDETVNPHFPERRG